MTGNQSTKLVGFLYEDLILDTFVRAADTFVKHQDGITQIWAASRDWFLEEWGRDTFISLPGILLATKRFSEATEIMKNFAEHEKNGLIPNRIQKEKTIYNTADAPMWFIQAAKSYWKYSGDLNFVREMLPLLRKIVDCYRKGTSYHRFGNDQIIKMDENDALIMSPAQATWMDADPSGTGQAIVTPRNGKTVEINALWYDNLRFIAKLEKHEKNLTNARDYDSLAGNVKDSFNGKFWNAPENTLFDVVEGDPHGGAIRPNMVFVVSHGGDLLPDNRKTAVFESAKKDLLTPGGLRSLSPRDSHYIGVYDTYLPIDRKDWAYHQGTVWPWLIGPFCDALAIVRRIQGGKAEAIRSEISCVIGPLLRFCMESPYKSLPEVFSGDPPYEPGGTTSQAWSIAEVLRILDKYGICKKTQ
jgi:predicted glycogen debranching enzyme